jgi:hypothetical protein
VKWCAGLEWLREDGPVAGLYDENDQNQMLKVDSVPQVYTDGTERSPLDG